MDINHARTFLEIVATGNFLRAADRLHITQTAVSARVRALEELLGRKLFVRNKSGASLTPAGERFLRYAQTLVQVWERARHQVAVPPGRRGVVMVGCELSLWEPLLVDWLLWMRHAVPQVALRAEVGMPGSLIDEVTEGILDIAVVYAPQQRPGLNIELLIEEKLVLVTTSRRDQTQNATEYVFVDWGREFAAHHNLAFPELSNVGTFVGFGPLGLEYLLQAGGSGYFRLKAVQRHLKSGRLHRVPGAPEFPYPAYAVYSDSADPKIVTPALAGLRHVAAGPRSSEKKSVERRAGSADE
ncbi:LysR family transcriptional regulator [Aromatoleum evansii]|uniref:LysR family transcriptional regulator n=1 Tax=Aromatoleum evansii TaxID=59406 RepID=A0ABZ1ASI6_AROEV|nr:LysR family transcriptional regulator [Aromatoleum evansii]